MSIVPMLAVRDAEKALQFYADVFGAIEVVDRMVEDGKISHSEFTIGGERIMLADEMPGHNLSPEALGGSPIFLFVAVNELDEVVKKALADGATLLRPISHLPDGERLAKLKDPFGHTWMLHAP